MAELSDEELIARLEQEVRELQEKQQKDPVIRCLLWCNIVLEYEILQLKHAKDVSKLSPHSGGNLETHTRPIITDGRGHARDLNSKLETNCTSRGQSAGELLASQHSKF